MSKSLLVTALALAIVSLGSLSAQAGGATSAPSKYNNAVDGVKQAQIQTRWLVQATDVRITEFSSSSAKSTASKR
jgi:hypothetical protein